MKLVASYCVLALSVIAVPVGMRAQVSSTPEHHGMVDDWSTHKIVFSGDALLKNPDLLTREPRVLFQAMRHWQAPTFKYRRGTLAPATQSVSKSSGDWNVSLVKSHVSPNMYPVKYTDDPSLPPDCQNDFAAFGLQVAGANGGTANLVAFNNLYSPNGVCPVAGPSVLFAYNTSTVDGLGKITTSPILSLDGTKVAFVESVAGSQAVFHVLTWTRGQGTITAAAPATAMTSLTLSTTSGDTISSPWIDYANDSAYVGSDNGILYKINGVFRSTPVLAAAWPITSNKYRLGPPVVDSSRNLLVVGSGNASLYSVDVNTGIVQASQPIGALGAKYAALQSSPVIDISTGLGLAVSANDGSSAVLKQFVEGTLAVIASARIGAGGRLAPAALTIQSPIFDNKYYVNGPASGTLRVCGTSPTDSSPYEYAFRFNSQGIMGTTSTMSRPLSSLGSATSASCTPMTEFYNPNIGGGTDFFFYGLTSDCTAAAAAGGCVISEGTGGVLTKATVNGGPSGIVPDNYSPLSQAHSIYFTALKLNTAYKVYQDTLK